MVLKLCFFLAFVFSTSSSLVQGHSPQLVYEWTKLEYEWENNDQKNGFVVENNALTGLKVWKNRVFVTVPRWRHGVPSTLNEVISNDQNQPILRPYPSWQMQSIEDPGALQYVQSMEIDSRGWMWILDVGRRNFLDDPDKIVNSTAKLIIWDLNNNCSIKTHVFPNHVLPWSNSFANDIVIDQQRGYAYISNTMDKGGIIVYSFVENESWRFDHPTLNGDDNRVISINGINYNINSPSDGIALSRDSKTLFYSSISKENLYSIPTYYLTNKYMSNSERSKGVVAIGMKYGYADGLTTDSDGNLYYGDFAGSSVYSWKIGTNLASSVVLAHQNMTMQWPDTFAWDDEGYLYFSSNKLQKYFVKTMQFDGSDGSNFRIWKVKTNSSSYLKYSRPVPFTLPCLLK